MRIEVWTYGSSLGHFSADEMTIIRGNSDGPIVAVIDEQGACAIMQPIDPQTGEDWKCEADAVAFAERYLGIEASVQEESVLSGE